MDNIELSTNTSSLSESEQQALKAVQEALQTTKGFIENRKFRAAKIAICRALTIMPDNFELWGNLSGIMWELRAYEDALQCAVRAVSLNKHPNPLSRVQGLMAMGNALSGGGNQIEAVKVYDKVLEIDPGHKDARWNRCLQHLAMGEYLEGWDGYHIRIERDKDAQSRKMKNPEWKGEPLTGKRIHVLHDQGYGDTLMYSRFLPILLQQVQAPSTEHVLSSKRARDGAVFFSTSPNLVPLLYGYEERTRNFRFTHSMVADDPGADYHVYIGSLPSILGTSINDIPPPDPGNLVRSKIKDLIDRGASQVASIQAPGIDPTLKVGICWSGRPDFQRNDERKVPLQLIASIPENPHIWMYSLQMGPPAQDLYDLGLDSFIQDLQPELEKKGWLGTATAMAQMDIILTCDTSIAHLAGMLGIPTIVMLHTDPYWPWGLVGPTTPWYPTTRLVRQNPKRRGDWALVVEEARTVLQDALLQKAQSSGHIEWRL